MQKALLLFHLPIKIVFAIFVVSTVSIKEIGVQSLRSLKEGIIFTLKWKSEIKIRILFLIPCVWNAVLLCPCGKLESLKMPFKLSTSMAWREQRDHHSDCYFCKTSTTGYNNKSVARIQYPNLQSAIRPKSYDIGEDPPIPPELPPGYHWALPRNLNLIPPTESLLTMNGKHQL